MSKKSIHLDKAIKSSFYHKKIIFYHFWFSLTCNVGVEFLTFYILVRIKVVHKLGGNNFCMQLIIKYSIKSSFSKKMYAICNLFSVCLNLNSIFHI